MSRLQRFLVALTGIIVEYHAQKFKQTKAEDRQDIIEKIDDDEADFVDLSVPAVEKSELNLQELISEITNHDVKRQTLWQCILDIITIIKPLVMTQRLLTDDELGGIKEQLVQFITVLQQLLNTQAPHTIIFQQTNQESVEILGFLNEFQNGYGLCKSGLLIRDKLLNSLFPSILYAPIKAIDAMIGQTVTDMLQEYQYPLLQEENKTLRYANEILCQQASVANKLTVESSTQTTQVSTLSIFTKYMTWSEPSEGTLEQDNTTIVNEYSDLNNAFFYDG